MDSRIEFYARLIPNGQASKAIADSQGTLLLMVKGPQRPEVRAPLALPPPHPEAAGKQDSTLAVFQHPQEDYEDESQLEVVRAPQTGGLVDACLIAPGFEAICWVRFIRCALRREGGPKRRML